MQEGIVLENEGNAKSMPGVGVKLVGPGVRLLESPSSATWQVLSLGKLLEFCISSSSFENSRDNSDYFIDLFMKFQWCVQICPMLNTVPGSLWILTF